MRALLQSDESVCLCTYEPNLSTLSGVRQSNAVLAEKSDNVSLDGEQFLHPTFPGDGILFLGQEQETVCGGFDDFDSLSADVSEFQASLCQLQTKSKFR